MIKRNIETHSHVCKFISEEQGILETSDLKAHVHKIKPSQSLLSRTMMDVVAFMKHFGSRAHSELQSNIDNPSPLTSLGINWFLICFHQMGVILN